MSAQPLILIGFGVIASKGGQNMADDAGVRLAAFRAICAERELTPSALSAQLGSRVSYWSDLLSGRKSFGEKVARRIEDGLGLPRYALDAGGAAACCNPYVNATVAKSAARDILEANLAELSRARWGRANIRRLAAEADVSIGTAQRVFRGELNVGVDVLEKLAACFGVTPAQLLQPNLGADGYSQMARVLADSLDKIEDATTKQRVWALALLVIDRQDLPLATSAPSRNSCGVVAIKGGK